GDAAGRQEGSADARRRARSAGRYRRRRPARRIEEPEVPGDLGAAGLQSHAVEAPPLHAAGCTDTELGGHAVAALEQGEGATGGRPRDRLEIDEQPLCPSPDDQRATEAHERREL